MLNIDVMCAFLAKQFLEVLPGKYNLDYNVCITA